MRRARTRVYPGLLLITVMVWLAWLSPGPISAQATRTWVSGVGDDANPCSRTAPCRSFAGAIIATAPGGEINVIDPGAYGVVTVTQAISIVGGGQTAGVLGPGTNGIIVNAGVNDVVTLRGLDIEGAGTGLNGIRFLAGKALHVENTSIRGFRGGTGRGIDMQHSASGELFVTDVEIANGGGAGVFVTTSDVSGLARVTLDNVRLTNNAVGLEAGDRSDVTVRNSVAAGNTTAGFRAQPGQAAARLALESSTSVFNNFGIIAGSAGGPPVTLVLSSSLVLGNNSDGIAADTAATVISSGDNRLDESVPSPTPTLTPTLTPTPTRTPTPTATLVSQPICAPRPPVTVSTVQNGPGQFRATVRVTSNPGGAPNTIQTISFGQGANARVDMPNGPANSTGNVNAPQPANTTEVAFTVRREAAGAFTLPFTVVDACGAWPSFVGGGAGVP